MDNNTWYSLDNQANIYPAVSDAKNTNVFRLSCKLKQPIQPTILQQALDKTMPSFPYYSMIMRRGLFWFYFEPSELSPKVNYESDRPCKEIFHIQDKNLLFQISYFDKRINLEVFHALADGGGSIQLLKTLVHHYLILEHSKEILEEPILDYVVSPTSQAEDGFNKHYSKDGDKQSPFKKKAFIIGGTKLPLNSIRVISAEMPTKQILALAKANSTTLTAYITALMICAIYEEAMPKRHINKDISIMVPVDLRAMFPSQTFRNFFSVVDIRYNFKDSPTDFNSVLLSVQEQFVKKVNAETLAKNLNYNMSMQNNIFARAVPLFIKNRVLKLAYMKSEKTNTTVISNVGRVTMPSCFTKYIDNFSCLINPTPIHRVKLCLSSYENTMKLNFSSCIEETGIQRYFIRHLAENKIDVTITTNGGDMNEILPSL